MDLEVVGTSAVVSTRRQKSTDSRSDTRNADLDMYLPSVTKLVTLVSLRVLVQG